MKSASLKLKSLHLLNNLVVISASERFFVAFRSPRPKKSGEDNLKDLFQGFSEEAWPAILIVVSFE